MSAIPAYATAPGFTGMMGISGILICERLEARCFLSATLTNGHLKAFGTGGADEISVSPATRYSLLAIPFDAQVEVHINGQISTFKLADVRLIEIRGLAGDDHVFVGRVADFPMAVLVKGGDGADSISGSRSNDTIFGGGGDDSLMGAGGDDVVKGGDGDDEIDGGIGNDFLMGGLGDDIIRGSFGLDTLEGNRGNDELFGNDGDDELLGGFGSDFLIGGAGVDYLRGGPGSNTIQQD